MASLPPISADLFTDRVLQAREESSANVGKSSFQKTCEACRKTYYSDNAYQNHLASSKHKSKELAMHKHNAHHVDDASSLMNSTFSLGQPTKRRASVDSDAEAEFTQVVERLKNADLEVNLQERPSPVKRPSNPHLSAAGQRKVAHPVSDSTTSPTAPISAQITPDNRQVTHKTCLFCSYDSPSLILNVTHMERIHSMFIPERQFLVDLPGLIGFLQKLVYENCECLVCGKVKVDPFAIQTHMRDAGHCKIPYFTENEMLRIGDYYDFRSTYSDDGEDANCYEYMHDNDCSRIGLKRSTVVVEENGEAIAEDDEGWETDSDASSIDTDEITSLPKDQHIHQYEKLNRHLHHSHSDPRKHHQSDGFHSHAHKHAHHAAFYDDYELHLPNGKSVGHRSLVRYYKQNLRDYLLPDERAAMLALEAAKVEEDEAENATKVDEDEGQSRDDENGGSGSTSRAVISRTERGLAGVADYKKKEVRKDEFRSKAAGERRAQRVRTLVNNRSNNQKHYYYREG